MFTRQTAQVGDRISARALIFGSGDVNFLNSKVSRCFGVVNSQPRFVMLLKIAKLSPIARNLYLALIAFDLCWNYLTNRNRATHHSPETYDTFQMNILSQCYIVTNVSSVFSFFLFAINLVFQIYCKFVKAFWMYRDLGGNNFLRICIHLHSHSHLHSVFCLIVVVFSCCSTSIGVHLPYLYTSAVYVHRSFSFPLDCDFLCFRLNLIIDDCLYDFVKFVDPIIHAQSTTVNHTYTCSYYKWRQCDFTIYAHTE